MKVIFLKDVPRIGKKYEVKEINDGHAMNFLIPRGLAETATLKKLAKLELHKKEIETERQVQADLLMKNMAELKDKVVTIKAKADKGGHLFSAIHIEDIAQAMKDEYRVDIIPEFIVLETPIKQVGEFQVPIVIKNQKSSFKLIVEAI